MDKNSVLSVLDEYADRGMSNVADLRPAVLNRVRKASSPHVGRRLWIGPAPAPLVLAGLALALFLTGAVIFWSLVTPTKPVSAAEILARAGAAQPGNFTNGVRSSHAIMSVKYHNSPTEEFVETQSEWWDQTPDKSRTETSYLTADGKPSQVVVGRVGSTLYTPWAGGKEFRISTRSSAATSVGTGLDTAIQQISRWGSLDVYDAVLTGTEAVAGRMAYVIELTVKPTIKNLTPAHFREKVWIDQQAYLVLRDQGWDKNGVLVYEAMCEKLEVNPSLAASLFEFKPSVDAIVADMRPATSAEIESGWKDAAGKLRTPLFRADAASYPDWVAGRPYYEPSQGVVSQAFRQETHSSTGGPGLLTMVISEGPASAPSLSLPGWGEGTQVQVGSLSGRMYRKDQAGALIFDRNGTRIMIYVPANASRIQSTLIATAVKMQRVSEK